MLPVTARWARFGPPNRAWFTHVPRGGFCVSAFLIVRNERGDLLLGRPRPHRYWAERGCLPNFRVRELIRQNQWILPASHFLMNESPAHAARRVARTWAGLPRTQPRLVSVDSELFPLRSGPGTARHPSHHWALCFTFEATSDRRPRPGPLWAELSFVPVRQLRSIRLGRDHWDILRRYLRLRRAGPASPAAG